MLLENLGIAPVNLGAVSIEVYKASPNETVKKLFDQIATPEMWEVAGAGPAPAAPAPSAEIPESVPDSALPPNAASKASIPSISDKSRDAQRPIEETVARIGTDGLTWELVPSVGTTRQLDSVFQPSQKGTVPFEFIIAGEEPHWYRFVITVSPKKDDKSWRQIQIDTIVPCGKMPEVQYQVSRIVNETRTTEGTEPFRPSAPPVPAPSPD